MKRTFLFFSLIATLLVILTACSNSETNAGPVINETLSRQSFSRIRVNAGASNIQLIPAQKAKVIYNGPDKIKPTVNVKNDVLNIKQKNFNVTVTGTSSLNNVIKIYLPKKLLSTITVHSENGNIVAGNLLAKHINFSSANGNIRIANLTTTDGVINSSDGNITINQLTSTNGFNAYTSEGYILIKKTNASGFKLSSSNGEVTINAGNSSLHGHSNDSGSGGSYEKNIHSNNVLQAISDDGDLTIK